MDSTQIHAPSATSDNAEPHADSSTRRQNLRKPLYAVVVSKRGEGPVNSATLVKDVANMAAVPAVVSTKKREICRNHIEEDITVVEISWEGLCLLECRTETNYISVWYPSLITAEPIPTNACVVRSLKQGWQRIKQTKQPQESMLKDSYEKRDNTKATHVAVMLDRQRSPVDSAETLKELAGLTVLPSTVTATRATWGFDGHVGEKTYDVAIVDLPAMIAFAQRMVFTEVPVWFDEETSRDHVPSVAVEVKFLKESQTMKRVGTWSTHLGMEDDYPEDPREFVPNPRFPVLLTAPEDERPITSVEALKTLLGLQEYLWMNFRNKTQEDGNLNGDFVAIVQVPWEHLELLEELAETDTDYVWFIDARAIMTIPRVAYVVKSIRSSHVDCLGAFPEVDRGCGSFVILETIGDEGCSGGPASLSQILGLPSTLQVCATAITKPNSRGPPGQEVRIADISKQLKDRLCDRTKLDFISVSFTHPNGTIYENITAYYVQRVLPPTRHKDPMTAKFESYRAAVRDGTLRFLVLISKPGVDTPITVGRIQKLCELSAPPRITTTKTVSYGAYKAEIVEVQVIDLSSAEFVLLQARAHCEYEDRVLFPDSTTGKPMPQSLSVVKKVREKWLESLEWEESLGGQREIDDKES